MPLPRPRLAALLSAALITACTRQSEPGLAGSLEWDRIAVPAEASEPILRIAVAEGQRVTAGTLLAQLDDTRAGARLKRAEAELRALERLLDELRNGTRAEALDAARARAGRARAGADEAAREAVRVQSLWEKKLAADSARDRARSAMLQTQAELAAAAAELDELEAGTRTEQVARAEAQRDAALASRDEARVAVERMRLVAPRDGRIDALPYKAGDRPPAGGAVVSLLVGEGPYARVFVPSSVRASVREGERFSVRVNGIEAPFTATLRSVSSEPAFTPYYALTGDDASRLAYRAELVLEGDAARDLPAGLPLVAEPAP